MGRKWREMVMPTCLFLHVYPWTRRCGSSAFCKEVSPLHRWWKGIYTICIQCKRKIWVELGPEMISCPLKISLIFPASLQVIPTNFMILMRKVQGVGAFKIMPSHLHIKSKIFTTNTPFILGIQTPWQKDMCRKYGHDNVLAMDSTFGTNKYKVCTLPMLWILI